MKILVPWLRRHRSPRNRRPVAKRTAARRRPSLERLEDRTVLSATFGSAVALDFGTMDIAIDAAGNTYMAGAFRGTVDFDPAAVHSDNADILTAVGANDAFFAKYASDGSLLWTKQFLGSAGSTGVIRSIATDSSGNLYLAGDFTGTISVGASTLTSGVDRDGFVAKINPQGDLVWANRWDSAGREYANGIAVDLAGNVALVGTTTKINADGSLSYTNFEVRKLNASGGQVWAHQIGNTAGGDQAHGVATDSAGNIYVAGRFTGKVDFDPSAKSKIVDGGANSTAFVLKLTLTGSYGWVSPFLNQNSTSHGGAKSIAVDRDNSIIVGGYSSGSIDFDPGKAKFTLPSSPGFVVKLSSAGALVWASTANGSVDSLTLDTFGSIYVTGMASTLDCKTDVFVAKLNATGTQQWSLQVGGTELDYGLGIAVDPLGTISVVGVFGDTVDFDPDPFATYLLTSEAASSRFLLTLMQS